MNYKKYTLFFITLLSFGSAYAYDETKIETFYYVTTLETIGKYVDNEHTTLSFLYEYDDFLNEKIAVEYDSSKLGVLYKLQSINQQNIKKQLISLDTSKANIEIFIKYFEGKNPEYQKNIDLIKTTGVLNSQDENGDTLLKYVIKNGSFTDIDFALGRGLNPNIKDKNGNVVFYDFIKTGGKFYPNTFIDKLLAGKFDEAGTLDIVRNICKKGFDVNLTDARNENIIFATLDLKNQKILQLVLKNTKLNLNIKNIDGKTPLLYAIEKAYDASVILNLIADVRVDVSATDNNWNNAFHLLAGKEKEYFTELFKRSININSQNRKGETELSKIVLDEVDETKIIEKYELLKSYKPLDISLKDSDGNTALFKALLSGKTKVFQTLLKDTKDINTKNNAGQNMLIVASFASGSLETIHTILASGIEKNIQDADGNNALHFALKNMNYDVIQALVEAGVDINTTNNAGENIFTHAVAKNDFKLLEIALAGSINLNTIINKENLTVLGLLAKQNKTEMLKLILKNKNLQPRYDMEDTNGDNALSFAIKNKNLELLKLFLHYNAPVNTKNSAGKTPLMFASEVGDMMSVKQLLSVSNINVDEIDTSGKTALLYACSHPEENTLQLLLQKSSLIGAKDQDGKSCKDYLIDASNISKETLDLTK